MAGLGLRLASGDKLVINGAAIHFVSSAEIRLANHARFLFGRQIMAPAEATTPATRIYFALQNAHVGEPEERAAALGEATFLIDMFCAETTSESARTLLRAALEATREGRGWQALKLARRVISHESAVLERELSQS
jgi:flagellar biosynthesis repressor protein FlbT